MNVFENAQEMTNVQMSNLFITNQLQHLSKVCELHERIKGLNESLTMLHPIAVVNGSSYFVFDYNQKIKQYEFIMEHPTHFPISVDIKAAFPLDFYDDKIAAILTENTLARPEAHGIVFHEFVHCFQWNKYEKELKEKLEVNIQQMKAGNFSWEIDYPFPYEDDCFSNATEKLNCVPDANIVAYFANYHNEMKAYLNITDYEYLVWQEWKEGFARYVENLIRKELGMKPNKTELLGPFDRVSFYELGSRYICALVEEDDSLRSDLHKLFYVLKGGEICML